MRERVDLEGHRDERGLVSQAGDDRAELDDAVVARAAQRGDVGGDRGEESQGARASSQARPSGYCEREMDDLPVLRAGDADRDALAGDLREHFAAGRLTEAEFGERLDATYRATTLRELDALRADLPDPRPLPAPAAPRELARRRIYQDAGAVVILNIGCVAVWAAGGAGSFWPEWVMLVSGLRLLRDGWRLLGPGADPSVPSRRRDRRRLLR